MQVQLLGGTAPLKFWRAKDVKNLVRYKTTFKFECKYLWNGWSYQHVLYGVIKHYLSHVEQKTVNFGPLTMKLCLLILTQNQQCTHFRTTLDFDHIYLRNG